MRFSSRLSVLLICIAISGCAGVPHMYVYSYHQLGDYFHRCGISDADVDACWQTQDGSIVVPFERRLKGRSTFGYYVLDRDHGVPISHTDQLAIKGYPFPGTWYGDVLKGEDRQSGCVFRYNRKTHLVQVGEKKQPNEWIFDEQVPSDFDVDQLCRNGNVFYLIDYYEGTRQLPIALGLENNCMVFAPDPKHPKRYKNVDEFPLGGLVETVDPYGPYFLCQFAYGGFPPFIYNVEAHRAVGWAPWGCVLFLQDDWLSRRLINAPLAPK